MRMDRETGCLARAWGDLTSDKNWWQVILVMGIVNCVPVIGQVFTMGYLYDWAKEGAWGMGRPLPREIGDFKRRGRYGLIWLAVTLVWVLPVYIVGRVLGVIPAVGPFLRFLCDLVAIAAYAVSAAAVLRGVIYERILPGLQFEHMLKMAAHDVPGLARVFCIALIQVLVGIVALILVMIPAAPFIATILGMNSDSVFGVGLVPVLVLGIVTIVTSLFVWLAASVCATCVLALFVRAIGYWVGQFEPDKWGSPHDPLPFEKEEKAPERPEDAASGKADAEGTEDAAADEPESSAADEPASEDPAGEDAGAEGEEGEQEADGHAG